MLYLFVLGSDPFSDIVVVWQLLLWLGVRFSESFFDDLFVPTSSRNHSNSPYPH